MVYIHPIFGPTQIGMSIISPCAGEQHRFRGVAMRNMESFVVEEAMIAIDFVRSFTSRFLFLSTNVTWQIHGDLMGFVALWRCVARVGEPRSPVRLWVQKSSLFLVPFTGR